MAKVISDGHIWGLKSNQYLFRGNRIRDHFWMRQNNFHIWPWKFKVKVTVKIDQNLIR